jgi:hypothetical protein
MTNAYASALDLAGGAQEPVAINAELALSHLAVSSHHRRPLPSQGERDQIPVSP